MTVQKGQAEPETTLYLQGIKTFMNKQKNILLMLAYFTV